MRLRRVVDLSIPITDETPIYPGDPEPQVCLAATIARDGFNVSSVAIGSHTGTHCDAPYHFREDGAKIDEIPLEHFLGRAVVVNAASHAPRTAITWREIEPYVALMEPGVIVLVMTGWSEHRGSPLYFEHPYLDRGACGGILARGVRTIGIDAINIDPTPTVEVSREAFPCHELISKEGGVIIENLTDLDRIQNQSPFVTVFPLRLAGCDGAPTRATALEFEASGGVGSDAVSNVSTNTGRIEQTP